MTDVLDEAERDDEGHRPPPRRLTPMESADGFTHYLELRRQQLITEIRMIEELLKMSLSFPRRPR